MWEQLEEAESQPYFGGDHTLQLSSPASPVFGSSLAIYRTASMAAAQLTKWLEMLLCQPGFIPAHSFLICFVSQKCPLLSPAGTKLLRKKGEGSLEEISAKPERMVGKCYACFHVSLSEVRIRIITYCFSFSCCAETVHWVFACLHHGIRFYNPLLASIRVIVLDGRSEQMSASAIHWPPDIYFNFIVGAYHALVT